MAASSWNSIRLNIPEYTRYDGLNAEWQISSYDVGRDTFYLTSPSLGNYVNTGVRWGDSYLDGSGSGAKFIFAKAVASAEVDNVGPFSFDLGQPFGISSTNLVLNQKIRKGKSYSTILVVDGAFSVPAGFLLFNYGYSNQVGPVRYLGATDDQTLMIDAGFKFPQDLEIGDKVNVLFQRAAYQPESPIGSFWLTASNAGRAAAIDLLNSISAAGIEMNITTRYPGDRGLGNEGYPTLDNYKLSDLVEIFGRDDVDKELQEARGEEE
jgi:hypothetical protein